LAAPEPAAGPRASEAPEVAALLEVKALSKAFGGFQALSEISLEASGGRAVGLVGPNGSGKTTLINVVSGVYKPSGGTVLLRGEDVTGLGSHKLCRLGLNRTFQNPRPLTGLTVAENVALVRPSRYSERAIFGEDPLSFVGLDRVASRRVSALTSGEQKLLDLARALAARPEVLLVDELGAGLNPGELAHVAGLLRQLKDAGMALVVVEHLMGFLEQVVDTVTVLNAGVAIFRGDLRSAVADRRVVEVFLGEHQR
jgi:branched-chain amino acid transport system ATP-binding protein